MRTAFPLALAAGMFLAVHAADDAAELANVRRIHERIVARQAGTAARKAGPYKVTIPNTTVAYDMVPVPAGEFAMGSPATDPRAKKDEQPQHPVRVDAFWMQAHEVTWDEYRLFMFATQGGEIAHQDDLVDAVSRPTRPYVEMSFGMGIEGFPAISMTQHAANKYAEWLSARTGEFYRLPTEAEWEYGCRAGTTTTYHSGDTEADLGRVTWYGANSKRVTHRVGQKDPNAFGLYDMHGNVWQWCQDYYGKGYYGKSPVEDTLGPAQGVFRVLRGGSWDSGPVDCRSAFRCWIDPDIRDRYFGFRVVVPASWAP